MISSYWHDPFLSCWNCLLGGMLILIDPSALGGDWSMGWWVCFRRWDSTGGSISTSFGLRIEKRIERGFINRRGWGVMEGALIALLILVDHNIGGDWGSMSWKVRMLHSWTVQKAEARIDLPVGATSAPLLDISLATPFRHWSHSSTLQVLLDRYWDTNRVFHLISTSQENKQCKKIIKSVQKK